MHFHMKHLAVIAVFALVSRAIAVVPLAEWYTAPAALSLPEEWQRVLHNCGRTDPNRTGNDLYPDNGSGYLYTSGLIFKERKTQFVHKVSKRKIFEDVRGRTIVHVVLNDKAKAEHLILASFIRAQTGNFRDTGEEKLGRKKLTLWQQVNDESSSSSFTLQPCPFPSPCPICQALGAGKPAKETNFNNTEMAIIEKEIYTELIELYRLKLKEYTKWAKEKFGSVWADVPLALNEENNDLWPFHTEIMLLYDCSLHGKPFPKTIYSRYSMCKSCEPAVVRAAGNNQVWFVSRRLYPDSYCAGTMNSKVKKIVLPANSDYPMTLDKLRAHGARNDLLEVTFSDVWDACP